MPPDVTAELWHLVTAVAYFGAGFVLFLLSIWLIGLICPFSFRKEIEEDQNVALAVLVGSGMLALAIIVSAAIR